MNQYLDFQCQIGYVINSFHHRLNNIRQPTPATALTPQQYHWRRRPCCYGSVARVALASSSSAGRPRRTGVRRAGIILVRAWGASIIFSCLFGEKILEKMY